MTLGRDDTQKPLTDANRSQLEQLGFETIGPIICHYLARLDTVARHFERTKDAQVLFVARAGIRIRFLLEAFQKAAGRPALCSSNDFFASRLMVAKGIWQRKPNATKKLLRAEFGENAPIKVAEALLAKSAFDPSSISDADLRAVCADPISAILDHQSSLSTMVLADLVEQSSLFEQMLTTLTGETKTILLVDSGWQGTAQTLLADAYGDRDWWGAYFGRIGFESSDRRYFEKMLGLAFQADQFDPAHPRTAAVLHRHLFENLFEPDGPSASHLERSSTNEVISPSADKLHTDRPVQDTDPLYYGVYRYVCDQPHGSAPCALSKAAQNAWIQLAKFITFPTTADVSLFQGVERSADFGRSYSVGILHEPKDRSSRDSSSLRIAEALWPSGQAVLEYGDDNAASIQKRIAGVQSPSAIGLLSPKVLPDEKRPTVSVITRTMDRPIFLKRALKSVSDQSFTDYKHVVVCDGGDIELVRRSIEETAIDASKIVLVDNVVNRGMEAASNVAINSSDSEFVVIHDDDDTWERDFLERTIDWLTDKKNVHYGGVITQCTYVSEYVAPDLIVETEKSPFNPWVDRVSFAEMSIGNFFAPIAFVFRRSVYDDIGGFNEDYPVLGDWDFNLRFLLNSDIGVLPDALANYHHRDAEPGGAFGNSVIAQRNKHAEYDTIVRNQFVRQAERAGFSSAAKLVAEGAYRSEVRGRIRDTERYAYQGGKTAATTDGRRNVAPSLATACESDEDWRAINAIISVLTNQKDSQLRQLRRRIQNISSSPNPTPALQSLVKELLPERTECLTPAPDFNEKAYLEENEDVAASVSAGDILNGYAHWTNSGRSEGRRRPTK